MKKPTKIEITEQIKKLKGIKPTVRRSSMFGDDHHAAIDAQVDVLETGMNEESIHDSGEADNVRDAMLEARQWLDGELEDYKDLVASWQELVVVPDSPKKGLNP